MSYQILVAINMPDWHKNWHKFLFLQSQKFTCANLGGHKANEK